MIIYSFTPTRGLWYEFSNNLDSQRDFGKIFVWKKLVLGSILNLSTNALDTNHFEVIFWKTKELFCSRGKHYSTRYYKFSRHLQIHLGKPGKTFFGRKWFPVAILLNFIKQNTISWLGSRMKSLTFFSHSRGNSADRIKTSKVIHVDVRQSPFIFGFHKLYITVLNVLRQHWRMACRCFNGWG